MTQEASLHVAVDSVIHECPPGDEGLTPCCNRTPLQLPGTDRMTVDRSLVTCVGPPGRVSTRLACGFCWSLDAERTQPAPNPWTPTDPKEAA